LVLGKPILQRGEKSEKVMDRSTENRIRGVVGDKKTDKTIVIHYKFI
jgi:hypothetical protein